MTEQDETAARIRALLPGLADEIEPVSYHEGPPLWEWGDDYVTMRLTFDVRGCSCGYTQHHFMTVEEQERPDRHAAFVARVNEDLADRHMANALRAPRG